MNKNIVYIVLAIIVLGGGFLLLRPMSSGNGQVSGQVSQTQIPGSGVSQTTPVTGASGTEAVTGGVTETKAFTVEGSSFKFVPNVMTVKKGDTVQITFKNLEGFHDWRLDEFNAKTKTIKAGETDTVSFVADKAGTFEYYCSIGQHRAQGMKGSLIVTE
jgi:nitrosocyanin